MLASIMAKQMQNTDQNTHTHTQPFYGSVEFVRDNPGEPVPEETFTHYTHRTHQSSLSAFSIYYDTWHPPYSIHVLFHNLSPSFLWSTSWPGTLHFILHTFLHPIIVFFSQHMPIEHISKVKHIHLQIAWYTRI